MNQNPQQLQVRPIGMILSLLPALALVLISLKVGGWIEWSWGWVLLPLSFHFLVCCMFIAAATFLSWARLFHLIGDFTENWISSLKENKNV